MLEINQATVCEVEEVPQLFCNSAVTDSFNQLRFASFIGRSATIQHVLANITVGEISSLTVHEQRMGVNKYFEKRVSKIKDTRFGELEHVYFLHDEIVNTTATKTAIMSTEAIDESRIWNVLKHVSELPLLDTWQETLLRLMRDAEMINPFKTVIGPVQGVQLNMADKTEYADLVSRHVKSKQLPVPDRKQRGQEVR